MDRQPKLAGYGDPAPSRIQKHPVSANSYSHPLIGRFAEAQLPVLRIDRDGRLHQANMQAKKLLTNINASEHNGPALRVKDDLNTHCWNNVLPTPYGVSITTTLAHGSQYLVAVAWSDRHPQLIDVGLVNQERLGINIDPSWNPILTRTIPKPNPH